MYRLTKKEGILAESPVGHFILRVDVGENGRSGLVNIK